ncbi:hypothetical protein L915_07276 [Phytophthora nicotianae]|uniref:SWIM-type domain-containing protein n=1 Tax=Phytophthora nicotianae TaxID=4792 RepID=W2H1U9_PHYNI|nr:hypothetical protein L915_07276 [Phytophthora nicotianae]ETL41866.1 hypothetical protein L916_07219 [Phytophthora nicotianae]
MVLPTHNVSTLRKTKPPKKKKKPKFDADDANQPIKSSHTLRMQWEGMPEDGWVVDVTTRACKCRFHSKYNLCPHIIEATKILGLPCPGFKTPAGRFQSRDKRQRSSTVRPSSSIALSHLQSVSFSDTPVSVHCPSVLDFEMFLYNVCKL